MPGHYYKALTFARLERGLSWKQIADQLWEQSAELNRRRQDHPISPATLTGIAKRGDTSCQHALFILRWLERTPESFLSPAVERPERTALPIAGPDRRLRWDLAALYEAVNVKRLDEALSWVDLATKLRCTEHQLKGIRTARFAISMVLAMRLVQWLDCPAASFIYAAER